MRKYGRHFFIVLVACIMLINGVGVHVKAAGVQDGNSMDSAIEFYRLPVANDNFTSVSSAYTVGFKKCSLASAKDVKWYHVEGCVNGFFDIRGISTTDFNFTVYDGDGNELYDSNRIPGRKIEKYWKPSTDLGDTYVKVYCNEDGAWMSNPFYISFGNPIVRGIRFNNVELRGININKTGYTYVEKDMSKVFTNGTILESLDLTSTNTKNVRSIVKRVRFSNSNSSRPQDNCERQSIGTTGEIPNVFDTRCGCVWRIGGQILGGNTQNTVWIPRASGRFHDYYLDTLAAQHYFD